MNSFLTTRAIVLTPLMAVLLAATTTAQAAPYEVRVARPTLRVAAGGTPPAEAPATPAPLTRVLGASASSLDLGTVSVGQQSPAQVLTLTNRGTDTVTVSGVSVAPQSSDFSQSGNCLGTLSVGASCTVSVTMSPTAMGARTASLSIVSDATTALAPVTLSGTGIAPVFATWNPSDRGSNLVLSQGNLVVAGDGQLGGTNYRLVRATLGKSSGKYVFEMTGSSSGSALSAGFANSAASLSSQLGTTGLAVGFSANGFATTSQATGSGNLSYSTTTVMFALDLAAGKGWIAQSGVWKKGNPATGDNPSFTWTPGTTVFPAVSINVAYTYNYRANFGASGFSNPVPAGFSPGWY